MVGKEDKPFLLGFGNFSVVNSLLNFGRVPKMVVQKTNMDTQNDGLKKVSPFKTLGG